jgi:hypothetical protein
VANESSVADSPEPRTHAQLLIDIASGRTELKATLDAIEDKVNVKKKVANGARCAGNALRELQNERPVVFVALGVGVALAVGAVAWLSVRAILKD